ncbi:MAG: hypothetical protein GX605_11245, partial [Chloroflexi bacterium]|nr:hypothetical protein [Chloroflexota bacterium]
ITRTPTRTPTVTRTPTRTPTSTLSDLRVLYVEVNQAIEGYTFFFDPIWYKPTAVRVYIDPGIPPGSPCVRNVTAYLQVYRDSGSGPLLATLFPYNPRQIICAPALNAVGDSPDWRVESNSLNFELPNWLLTGAIALRPHVNYDRRVAETNYDNNRGLIRTVQFRQLPKRLSIAYVPIHYEPSGYTGPQSPTSRMHTADAFLRATWPLRPDYIDYYRPGIPTVDWTDDVNVGSNDSRLLAHIARLWADLDPQPDHLYGWLPGGVFGGNGLAYVGRNLVETQHAAYGNDTDGSASTSRYRRTMAHELEHNHSFSHDCDTLGGRGYDVLNRVVKSDALLEVQCAGLLEREAWADINTYWTKYQAWGYSSAPTAAGAAEEAPPVVERHATPAAYVIASGFITETGQLTAGELSPLHRVTRSQVVPPPEGDAYCLVFLGQGDATLQSNCFDLIFASDSPDGISVMPFVHVLPWPQGAERVLLRKGAQTLAQRAASAHTPTVQLLSPNGGENWGDVRKVRWTSNDQDEDPLSFTLLYSNDNGATWSPLSADLSGDSFTVDTAELPGGAQCLVKVRASDGFHTVEDV